MIGGNRRIQLSGPVSIVLAAWPIYGEAMKTFIA